MTTGITMGNVLGIYAISSTLNPANIATATTTEQTFTVPGLKIGDIVLSVKPSVTAGISVTGSRVSAVDTLAITFTTTTTNVDAPSEVYQIFVARPSGGTNPTVIAD